MNIGIMCSSSNELNIGTIYNNVNIATSLASRGYDFVMGASENGLMGNVKDITEMYKSYGSGISEDERLFIAKAKRGQALFFVSGFDRHKVDIFVSRKEANNLI